MGLEVESEELKRWAVCLRSICGMWDQRLEKRVRNIAGVMLDGRCIEIINGKMRQARKAISNVDWLVFIKLEDVRECHGLESMCQV